MVVCTASLAVFVTLTPCLYAESLLDKALDTPPAATKGSDTTGAAAPAQIAPVTYTAPVPHAGTPGAAPAVALTPSTASVSSAAATAPAKPMVATAVVPAAHPGALRGEVTAVIQKFDPLRALHEHRFQVAAAKFPAFCRDWQAKLEERTRWNLSQINWHEDHGLESGTYTSYSPINSCTTKMSDSGVAIGKLSYDEYVYSLSGKSIEEAKHAKPKQVSVMRTLEIFRYDHNQWFE
jgi:hypothetical protein